MTLPHDHCVHPADDSLRQTALEGCEEARLLISRRAMLGVTASLFSWSFMPRWAEAASTDPRLLVVVLRGGMDGINVCIPHGDAAYMKMRGGIAIPVASAIKLDGTGGFFNLNPAMKNFAAMYAVKDAAFVHACCIPLRTRSHFDCQDNLESGLPGMAPDPTGWLNRLLSALPAGAPVKTLGAIEIGEAPLILRGPAPVLGWSPTSTWLGQVDGPLLTAVQTLYNRRDPVMGDMLARGIKADRLASRFISTDDNISSLRQAFRGAGALIAAPTGPRIAVLSVYGFDTHADQGATQGYLADMLTELDLAIADFKAAVGAAWPNTAMVLATEFGRCVPVNGDLGTDHGVGTTALLVGGAVNGGQVFGDWPGIAPPQLYGGMDLRATTDLRSVFKGVLRDHLGVGNSLLNNAIFPSSATAAPAMSHLIKSSTASASLSGSTAPLREEPPIARYRKGLPVSSPSANGA